MKRCEKCDKWLSDYEARRHKCEEDKSSDIVDDILTVGMGLAISSMFDDDNSSSSSSNDSSSDYGGGGESLGGGSSDSW